AAVARDVGEPVDRKVEDGAVVLKVEEVDRRSAERQLGETEVLADAVHAVDDVVVDLELREVGDAAAEALAGRGRLGRLADVRAGAEDLLLGDDDEAVGDEAEALGERADEDVRRSARGELEQVLGPGLAVELGAEGVAAED